MAKESSAKISENIPRRKGYQTRKGGSGSNEAYQSRSARTGVGQESLTAGANHMLVGGGNEGTRINNKRGARKRV